MARRAAGVRSACDEGLAQRIRDALEEGENVSERKMSGSLAVLLGGDPCVGIVRGAAFAGSLPPK